jgi:glutaredoxin 3
MQVHIYSKTGCDYCQKAKDWFRINQIEYNETLLDDQNERMDFYQKISNGKEVNSVPQIFIDEKHIGGYVDLVNQEDFLLKKAFGGLETSSVTYKPFRYPWAVDMAQQHEKIHWIPEEVSLEDDVHDWKSKKLSQGEKDFIRSVLTLFVQSDVNVGENYINYYLKIFKNNEIRKMLASFAAREFIHQEAYALFNDTIGFPESDYSAFLDIEQMRDKHDFMLDIDIHSKEGIGLSIAKSVINEGLVLFSSFAMLLNFQRFGKLKGFGKINEWSIRDENLHAQGMAKLFKTYCNENPRVVNDDFKKKIYSMVRTAVKLEDIFIERAFGFSEMEGLTIEEMKMYIRYMADRRLIQLGMKGNYKVKDNPLSWLDFILNAPDHTNFFENRVTEYSVGGLTGKFSYDFLEEAA